MLFVLTEVCAANLDFSRRQKRMAEDCSDGDYLGAYSRFFSEFVARVNPYDQLPVSVSSYNVTEAEIVGEIINVTLQYLNQT